MKDALRSAVTTLVTLLAVAAGAASDPFTGRFIDEQRTVAIEIEFYDGVYSGVLTDGSSLYYDLTAQADGEIQACAASCTRR